MFKRFIFPIFIILLSVAGILLSYMLTEEYHYGSIPQNVQEELAFFTRVIANVCGEEDSFMGCSTVTKSKYSKIFNMPVAALGIVYYVILCFLMLMMFFAVKRIRPAISVLFFWVAMMGSLIDIALLIISIFIIDALCPMCLATYVCTWICLSGSIIYLRQNNANPFRLVRIIKAIYLPGDVMTSLINIAITGFILVIAASLGYGSSRYLDKKLDAYKEQKDKEAFERAIKKFADEKSIDLILSPLMMIGDPNAPITIVEFSDFLCPYCGQAAKAMDELVKNNPSKVSVVFMNYPLDIVCNRYMRREGHPGACLLAAGAICAAEQDRFEEYQQIVFDKRPERPRLNELKDLARLSDLEVSRFIQCVANKATWKTLVGQIEKGKKYNVNSTPTIFINNKKYEGKAKIEWLQKVIDMELERISEGESS